MDRLVARMRSGLFEPLYALKSQSPKLDYWHHLERTQYLPRRDLEKVQEQRFQDMWNFLWHNNEFYRNRFLDYGISQKSIKNPGDIGKLPIIAKKEIRVSTDQMISAGYSKAGLLHFKTGGSTGKALDIFITEECSELRNACARRHDRWAGWEPGEPIGAVWGNPKLPRTLKQKLLNWLVQPLVYLDTMAVTDASVKQFAFDWKKVRPTLLFGHAHSIYVLAQYVKRLGVESIQPKGIISTSMMLMPHERALIEEVFRTKVTDRYGCEEVSLIGSECAEHRGLHMNIEHLIIEFIKDDGTSARPGEPGRIIVTDLMNKAMPFIRYSVEDIGVPLAEVCACGRGLPLMGKVAGRVADFLIKKDGTKIAGVSIIENTLTKLQGIDQMQIIQETLDNLTINIVPNTDFSSETAITVINYFRELFAGEMNIEIKSVGEIKPEPSGKFRFSICKVSQN